MTFGTPAYMAPEQAMGGEIGPRTDLYSLGVMAYELASGRLPFPPREGETPLAVLFRHITEAVPPIRTLRPDVDPRLAQWIERLLAKEPSERPASAPAAWDELEELTIAALGPLWRREAPLPALGASAPSSRVERDGAAPAPIARGPVTPAPPPAVPPEPVTTPPAAVAPEPATPVTVGAPPLAAAPPGSTGRRPRGRRAALLGCGLAIGAVVAAVVVLSGVFGRDDPGTRAGGAIPAELPDCMRELTANVPHGSIVAGTSNQPFARAADTRDKPATVIFLDAATPVLAMRVIDHPDTNPPVFELQRSIDARCRSVAIENRGEGTSRVAPDWAPLRMTLGGRPYQAALNHDPRRGNIEAGLRALLTPSLEITGTRTSDRAITVEGKLAADAEDEVTALYAAPSGARFQDTAKPSGGLFRARIRLPRADAANPTGRVIVTYPGDDHYARATVTKPL